MKITRREIPEAMHDILTILISMDGADPKEPFNLLRAFARKWSFTEEEKAQTGIGKLEEEEKP